MEQCECDIEGYAWGLSICRDERAEWVSPSKEILGVSELAT
jgi:hypothetical protein